MSIWASVDLVDCYIEGCKGCEECKVGQPYIYYASHVLPEENMGRSGSVHIGYLSKFVRYYRDHPGETKPELEPEGLEPWLRFTVDGSTVILDLAQVKETIKGLTNWVDRVEADVE